MGQKWECPDGHMSTKQKPGASEGSRAMMRCRECDEKVLFECVEATDDDGGGVPWM